MSLSLLSRTSAGTAASGSVGKAPGAASPARPVRRQFRNEWKYYLSLWDADALRARIAAAVPHDEHAPEGGYAIRSLYFDDYWDTAYHNKIDGVQHRTKWRVRIYNCSDAVIKLERKVKDGAYIYKQSANLTREEFERIIDGDYAFLLASPQQLCREFYVACVSQIMRPKVIVDYEREPFVFDAGTVRITFDSNLRAAAPTGDIFNPDLPTYDVLPYGKTIMEVKFTEFFPQFIREMLPPGAQDLSAISKYVLCYEQMHHRSDVLSMLTKSEKAW